MKKNNKNRTHRAKDTSTKAAVPTAASATVADLPKSERTKSAIVAAALELFRIHGYEATTMALIAARAGVSKANAYYYFRSKDELMQSFYDELQEKHRAHVARELVGITDLSERIRVGITSWQDVARPYHKFGHKLFQNAADPQSPLSPFSPESAPARRASIAIMKEIVDGSDASLDDDMKGQLPTLLWMFHISIVLLWIFDKSAKQQRTRSVVQRAAPLITNAVRAASLPFLGGLKKELFALVQDAALGLEIAR